MNRRDCFVKVVLVGAKASTENMLHWPFRPPLGGHLHLTFRFFYSFFLFYFWACCNEIYYLFIFFNKRPGDTSIFKFTERFYIDPIFRMNMQQNGNLANIYIRVRVFAPPARKRTRKFAFSKKAFLIFSFSLLSLLYLLLKPQHFFGIQHIDLFYNNVRCVIILFRRRRR